MKRTIYLILLAAWLPLVLASQDAPLAPQPVIAGSIAPPAIAATLSADTVPTMVRGYRRVRHRLGRVSPDGAARH